MKSEVKITENCVQLTRIFEAPRSLVFAWWTRPEKLQQWSGCKGATQCEIQMDFRVGGTFTQKMQITGAGEFSFTGTYQEIVEPEKIVYQANLGFATTKVTVEFFEQGTGTKLVLTQEGLPSEFFCQTVSQGTAESFEKLDALVTSAAAALPR